MTTERVETYYKILGLRSNASVDEIKRAFRLKAMELHPDKNKSPDAHQNFILLTEAYEYLIEIKSGKSIEHQTEKSNDHRHSADREAARQKAREHAEMEFEKFKQTDYYKNSQAANTVLEHLFFLIAIVILLCPLWGFIIYKWAGLGVGVFFTLILADFWKGIFTQNQNLNFRSFLQSFVVILKTKTFKTVFILALNLFVLLRYTLNTQLSILSFALIFAVVYGINYFAFLFMPKAKTVLSKLGLYPHLAACIINLFFLTNHLFSNNPTTEVHSFVHEKQGNRSRSSRSGSEKLSYIHLDEDKYADYHWFRVFFDFDSMKDKSEITYTFEDGLFGLRVLKHYDFTK